MHMSHTLIVPVLYLQDKNAKIKTYFQQNIRKFDTIVLHLILLIITNASNFN